MLERAVGRRPDRQRILARREKRERRGAGERQRSVVRVEAADVLALRRDRPRRMDVPEVSAAIAVRAEHVVENPPADAVHRENRAGVARSARRRRACLRRSRSRCSSARSARPRWSWCASGRRRRGSDCDRPSSTTVLCIIELRKRSRSSRVHRVGRRSGIDQQRPSGDGERAGERVGVRVAAIQETVRAGVEDQMIAARRARHVVAARRQRGGRPVPASRRASAAAARRRRASSSLPAPDRSPGRVRSGGWPRWRACPGNLAVAGRRSETAVRRRRRRAAAVRRASSQIVRR